MEKLRRSFFNRDPETVARDLLGKFLVRKEGERIKIGRIVEAEAYLGINDLASHSSKGMTKRNEVMFGPPGFAYVYFTYGMHWLLNFITEGEGTPSGVLVRAVEPVYDSGLEIRDLKFSERVRLGSGPARLTRWLKISGELNKLDITCSGELYISSIVRINGEMLEAKVEEIAAAPRVGVDYAGEHKDLPLRFYLKGNKYVGKH